MNNLAILSLKLMFFIFAFLEKPQQSIDKYIYFALVIVDLEMILRKLLGLADLFRAQTLYIYKAIKIVLICEDKHFIYAIF